MVLIAIAMMFLGISCISVISIYPVVKKKSFKIACLVVFFVGIMGFASICFSMNNSERIDKKTSYKEYEIQRATRAQAYFNDIKMSYSDMVVEKPIDSRQNIVVVKIEHYKTKWLWFRVKYSKNTYHVYFSDDVYQEYLEDRNVIYER